MSRQSKIRYRENDLKELNRIVKNYNAKLSRQREKLIDQDRRYEASQLPKRASVREIKASIETRKDFNAELHRMQNYISTGERFVVDQNTKKSLHATARDFNAKVDRLSARAKTQGERAALPEKITPEILMKIASSKKNLQSMITDYKGFLKRGAETLVELPNSKNNIKLTKWQNDLMEEKLISINEARDREKAIWKATEVNYGGKKAGYTQGMARMDKGDYDEYAHMKKYNYSSDYSDMREKLRLIMRESQDNYWDARTELARINYLEKLDRVIGNDPIGKILLKQIKSLPLNDFKRVLLSEDDLFLDLYDLEKQKDNDNPILEKIWNEWNPDTDMYESLDNYIRKKVGE